MMININQLNTLKATAVFAFFLALALMPFSAQAYVTANGSYSTGYGYPTTGSNYSTSGNSGSGSSVAPTSRPTVSTEAATGVNYTKVTIQGAVYTNSGTANAWFEWGTRVDALTQTTRTQIINSTSSGITETLTNLADGTTYYYRIVARNERGISYGTVKSVTTLSKSGSNSTSNSGAHGASSSSSGNGTISGGLSASAANAEAASGFTPTSFFGWLVVIILIFAIVVIIRMIQRDAEEKKKLKEEQEKLPEPPRMKFA